jgi:hypothetical protein
VVGSKIREASIKPCGARDDEGGDTRMAEKKISPKAPAASKTSKEEKTAATRVTKGRHLKGRHLKGRHLK